MDAVILSPPTPTHPMKNGFSACRALEQMPPANPLIVPPPHKDTHKVTQPRGALGMASVIARGSVSAESE